MSDGFQRVLDHIRSIAGTEAEKGRLFERLMKAYFRQDPLYGDRFSDVWLWSEWRQRRPEFGPDIGIDLVAEERDGGYCAIQCKCHAPGTRIDKKALDSFISASARAPFTARIVVDTGDGWGPNAIRTLTGLEPECHVLRFGDLASRPFDWPDLVREAPETLSLRREPFRLRPHQEQAFNDVLRRFAAHDRGKLIMACGQDLHRASHRRGGRGRERTGALSGAVDLAVPAVHAGVGGAARAAASLHRHLFRHAGGAQRRGRLVPGVGNPRDDRAGHTTARRCGMRRRNR